MVRYVVHRVALAIVVLVGLLVATFFIIHLVPGDPVKIVLGGARDAERDRATFATSSTSTARC